MCQVTQGSLDNINLSDDVVKNICHVKKVPDSAWNTIVSKINNARHQISTTVDPEVVQTYKSLYDELQVCSVMMLAI